MKKNTIKLKTHQIIDDAIERGIAWGMAHAHKHTDKPERSEMVEHLHRDIMLALDEVIDFDDS